MIVENYFQSKQTFIYLADDLQYSTMKLPRPAVVLPVARSNQKSNDKFEPNITINQQTTKTCDDPICGPI